MLFDPDDPATLRPWLTGHLARVWRERVTDPAGGFFETLDADGAPVRTDRRTALVQARLTYVFAHAYVLGGDDDDRRAAEHGLAFLLRAFRAGDGGWMRAVSVDGTVIDETRDAYDQAFVLFALAWVYRATGDTEAIQHADATWAFMLRRLADPAHGGFAEEYAPGRAEPKLPRRQNPHMHLLEALLALHAATREKNWLRRAGAIVALFKMSFTDPATGALIEYFDADWRPAEGAAGALREPGHQFEWVWLLFAYVRASRDVSVIPFAERLFAFGTRYGLDTDGIAFDGIDESGAVVADTKLLWPQTEYLKACVARTESLNDHMARTAITAHLRVIARHFMREDGANWVNQLARDRTPLSPETPVRVLYHLFMGIAEAERLSSGARG